MIYDNITSIIGIILGILIIIFAGKLVDANKEYASKHTGLLFEKIHNRSRGSAILIARLVGSIFIILGILQLIYNF